ncbi:MAG: iron chelate uptake ABC transporter family permease subunit [Thermodesulfobacteriota bacterium]
MIASFVDSWALFHDSYLAGWLIALLLPLLGVVVVARDQIFLGAAISQASLLGIACGLRAGAIAVFATLPGIASDAFLSGMAGAFAVLAALLTTHGARGRGDSHESVTGLVFLLSASLSVLLLSHSPHGTEEIHRLLASTIIGATPGDVGIFVALVALTAAVVALRHRELTLLVMDPQMASAVGLGVRRWGLALAVWLGVVVGLSNRVAGSIFTFGCLVLPALAARNLCREVRTMFVVAPLVGLAGSVVSFVVAHDLDYPPGQTTAFVLSLVLIAAWSVRRLGSALRGA